MSLMPANHHQAASSIPPDFIYNEFENTCEIRLGPHGPIGPYCFNKIIQEIISGTHFIKKDPEMVETIWTLRTVLEIM